MKVDENIRGATCISDAVFFFFFLEYETHTQLHKGYIEVTVVFATTKKEEGICNLLLCSMLNLEIMF